MRRPSVRTKSSATFTSGGCSSSCGGSRSAKATRSCSGTTTTPCAGSCSASSSRCSATCSSAAHSPARRTTKAIASSPNRRSTRRRASSRGGSSRSCASRRRGRSPFSRCASFRKAARSWSRRADGRHRPGRSRHASVHDVSLPCGSESGRRRRQGVRRHVLRGRRPRDDDGAEDDSRRRQQHDDGPLRRSRVVRPADAQARDDAELRPLEMVLAREQSGVSRPPLAPRSRRRFVRRREGRRPLHRGRLPADQVEGARDERQGRPGRGRGNAARVSDAHASGERRELAMPEPPKLAKASLQEIRWTPKGAVETKDAKGAETKPIEVQFNPATLKVNYANQKAGGDQVAGSPVQFVGKGSTKLTLELWFDTTVEEQKGPGGATPDVREKTEKVYKFMVATPGTGKHKKDFVPPGIRFHWGSFLFDGVVDSMDENLEYFSSQGVPMRASV